jgi:hypothetical protein
MNSLAKLFAQIAGGALLLAGILGFFGGLAPNNQLLGIFAIDPLHNVVHILSGLAGLAAGFALQGRYARLFAGVFGIVYGLVTVVGFLQGTTVLGLIPVNTADNVLHLLIAAGSLGVFFLTGNQTSGRIASA